MAEQKDLEFNERDHEESVNESVDTSDAEQNRLDPLEGLDETTKICFLVLFFNVQ